MKNQFKLIILIFILLGIGIGVVYQFFFNKEGKTIHIALVGPLTGENARVGKSFLQGIHLYLNMINQKGGIAGKKIVLDKFDDKNVASEARERAYDIIEQNRAVAVIGHHYSNCSIAAGEVYKEYGIPAISPASTNVKVTENNDWYFRSSFNDNLQGRFLASYAKQVFNCTTVSIIHEDHEYGSYLANVFEHTSKTIGVDVKYKWRFSVSSHQLDKELAQIVHELAQKKDAGAVFISTHAPEGAKIVRLMKDLQIPNIILAPDAFASRAFQDFFKEYPKEKSSPGFYTNGIYVTTPLIFDTTNEKGLKFKDAYFAAYKEEPDWHAAFAYDTAMVLVEAIRNTNIHGTSQTIEEDRKKIRDYLANLSNIHDAIEGVTGYNYFDEKGDSQKPVLMGVYRNQSIISAMVQFQAIQNVYQVPNFEKALEEERVVVFDGRYSYKINVVYTGIRMNEISELNFNELSCVLEFFIWFRYRGGIDIQSIEFTNTVEPVQLGMPVHEVVKDQLTYRLYHVKGKFRMDFLSSQHIYGQHIVGLSFRPRSLDRNNLIFVKDILGMRLTADRAPWEKMIKDQVLNPSYGWKITDVWFFQDIAEKDSLGSPEYLMVEGGTLEYSRFNVGIRIAEDRFTLRRITSATLAKYLLIISIIISLFLSASVSGKTIGPIPNLKPFSKITWFFQVGIAAIILLMSEVYMLNFLSEHMTKFFFNTIVLIFDILWWVIPAYYFTVGLDRFVWTPLEQKSGRSIPHIIRNLVSMLVYLLALFAIVAFVFDQKLTSLLATSGVIAMIVGLAIQINIANIFSGIAINVERPFRIGDWVKIGDFNEGKVIDINWRATRIHTRDDTVLCIPNSKASESPIENFSFPTDCYWKYFTIHVDPIHPPDRVKQILLNAALSTEGVLNNPPPSTRFLGLTAGMTGQSTSWAANYLISVYVKDYGKKFAHNESVWLNVWTHLRLAGIRHVMERKEIHMLFEGIKPKEEKLSKTLSILQEIDIFQPFSIEAKNYLSQRMRLHTYPEGQIIVHQGDPGDSLYIIVEGALGVWVKREDGQSIEIGRLGAGNIFGEMALMTGEPRAATIISISETRLYEITKADIMPLMKKHPEIFGHLSEILSQRKMATASKLSMREEEKIDKSTLATQILQKIQSFFGFKSS